MQGTITLKELQGKTKQLLEKLKETFDLTEIFSLIRTNLYDKISIFLWLHTSKILDTLIEFAVEKQESFLSSDAPELISLIKYHFEVYFDVVASPHTKSYFKTLLENEKIAQKLNKMSEKVSEEDRENMPSEIKEMLLSLFSYEKSKKKKEIQKLINRIINFQTEQNIFNQIACNWMKWRLDNKKYPVCCKSVFFLEEKIENEVSKDLIECRKYKNMPYENDQIIYRIKRTIIGFLNSGGGMIILGINEKNSNFFVSGIKMKKSEFKAVVKFFREKIIADIHPQHPQFKLKQMETQFQYKTILNDYIQLEFHPVIDNNREQVSFTNYIDQSDRLEVLIKVIIRSGHPKHLYHLISKEKNFPQFYERKKNQSQRMQFQKAHETIYGKLNQFLEAGEDEQKQKRIKMKMSENVHENCRFKGETMVDFEEQFDLN